MNVKIYVCMNFYLNDFKQIWFWHRIKSSIANRILVKCKKNKIVHINTDIYIIY